MQHLSSSWATIKDLHTDGEHTTVDLELPYSNKKLTSWVSVQWIDNWLAIHNLEKPKWDVEYEEYVKKVKELLLEKRVLVYYMPGGIMRIHPYETDVQFPFELTMKAKKLSEELANFAKERD